MATPTGTIAGFSGAGGSVPSGWLLCDGSFVSQSTYSALFAILGHAFNGGTDPLDGTFKLPDLRGRVPLGVATSGTGSTLGGTGGAIDHTHNLTHDHTITQADAHTAHVVTQPDAHTGGSHTGLVIADHSALTHSISISNHTVATEATGHGTHSSDGAHTHDAHTTEANALSGTGGVDTPTTHSSVGGHTHAAHSAHTGSTIDAHTLSSSGHAAFSNTVGSSDTAHTASHSGATVTGAHTHTGLAAATSAGFATGSNNPPFQAAPYMVKT